MLTYSMIRQIEADETGYVWLKSVFLRIGTIFNHPFSRSKQKSYVSDYWGLAG